MTTQINLKRYSIGQEIANLALAGVNGTQVQEGQVLIQAIIEDWREQADETDLELILMIGKSDLKHALQGKQPSDTCPAKSEKLKALQNIVLERQIEKLSTRSFQLARQVLDYQNHKEVLSEAKMIASEVQDLLKKVKQVQEPSVSRRLRRDLADADRKCLYILNGAAGAMSRRLNRYMQTIPQQEFTLFREKNIC
jgi:hypothetical protein